MACLGFPSIEQFRQVVRNVKEKASFGGLDEAGAPIHLQVVFPTLSFIGTVKSHGTNASIRQDRPGGPLIFQSRARVITPTDDNAGFAKHCARFGGALDAYVESARLLFNVPADKTFTIYGEWCGGNVQKGVAITGLEKMFLPFAVRVGVEEQSQWIRCDHENFIQLTKEEFNFHAINKFQTFAVDVDFNEPELAQNTLVDLTIKVEEECPIGKAFGKSGIGEGIVWFCTTPGWDDSSFLFKTKGEKHSASRVTVIAAVDVEKVDKMQDLVNLIMTTNRMEQMVTVMKDRDGLDDTPKNIGVFLKTCIADALKEESDTIVQNGFEPKEFSRAATTKLRNWYLTRLQ